MKKRLRLIPLLILTIFLLSSCVLNKPTEQIEDGYLNIFTKTYGTNYTDKTGDVIYTSDKGALIGGYINFKTGGNVPSYEGNVDLEQAHEGVDLFLVKLDKHGEEEWQRIYGGTGAEWALSLEETEDNGYVVGGYTTSIDGDLATQEPGIRKPTYADPWILKLDSNGNLEWQKILISKDSKFDSIEEIKQTSDGGYAALIREQPIYEMIDYEDPEEPIEKMFTTSMKLVKLSSTGDIEWEFEYKDDISEDPALNQDIIPYYPYDFAIDENGEYFISGSKSISHQDSNTLVIKLNQAGEKDWEKELGGEGTDIAENIIISKTGDLILGGYTSSQEGDFSGNFGVVDYWVTKMDKTGNVKWMKFYGGSENDRIRQIKETPNGDLVMIGYTASNNGDVTNFKGHEDAWFLRTNSQGEIINERTFGGTLLDRGTSLDIIDDNTFLVAADTASIDNDLDKNWGNLDITLFKFFMEDN